MEDLLKQFHVCENRCSHLDLEVVKEYFPDGGFEEARDNFFSVREDDINEFYKLQYPFIGSIVFDGKVFKRLVRVVPEFVISIIKTGMPTIITLGELEVYEGNVPIMLSHTNLTPASEIIVECANLFNSIGLDDQNRSIAKINRLNTKLIFLEIGKSHYDLLGIMQSIYTSIVLAANGANMLESGIGHLYFHTNNKKRDLIHSLIGPILNPLRVVNSLPADTPMDDIQFKIIEEIRNSGQLELRPPADAANISVPALEDGPEFIFRLEGEYWDIRFGGDIIRLKDSKGLSYIQTLIKNPNKAIRSDVLASPDIDLPNIQSEMDYEHVGEQSQHYGGQLPDVNISVYRDALEKLKSELDNLSPSDKGYLDKIQQISDLEKMISNRFDKFGRRRPEDSGEKARQAVLKAISRDTKRVKKDIPNLFSHFKRYIKTGFECVYDPPDSELKSWQF